MDNRGYFEIMFSDKKALLQPLYFDIQVLDRYFEDPRYVIFYSDYRGSIVIDDKFVNDNDTRLEYIKDFGLAYHKVNGDDRAIVVFADDLIRLPAKVQSHFHAYLLDEQDQYYPNEGFVKNLILGEWVDTISIYEALTLELHYINEMCTAIGVPKMFLKEYSAEYNSQNKRPDNFHVILLPTEKRYYDFIITLEKMTTGNMNIKTFLTEIPKVLAVDRNDENKKPKGSLTLLVDWLRKNVFNVDITEKVEKPLRKLINERQTPAHKIIDNKRDKTIWKRQNECMVNVYTAVRNIRLILANHPKAKQVKIPDYLFDGEHISVY